MNVIDQYSTERYSLYNGDTTEIITAIPDSSVGLSVFSPPYPFRCGQELTAAYLPALLQGKACKK